MLFEYVQYFNKVLSNKFEYIIVTLYSKINYFIKRTHSLVLIINNLNKESNSKSEIY